MCRQHYRTAPCAMLSEQRFQVSHPLLVDGRKRLIQNPERRVTEVQARQCYPPGLSLGQLMTGHIFVARQPHSDQRGLQICRAAEAALQTLQPEQVLERGQFTLDARLVTDVEHIGQVQIALTVDGLATKPEGASRGAQRSRQNTQQRGFTGAIGAGYLQQITGMRSEEHTSEL